MTPSRRNNKHYPPETSGSGMSVRNNTTSSSTGFRQSQTSTAKNTHHELYELQRYDNLSQNNNTMRDTGSSRSQSLVREQTQNTFRSSSNHSQSVNQKTCHKSLNKINRNDEFIPLFVLVDASKEDNERKVREICRKLVFLQTEEAEPVVNFQDQTGRVSQQLKHDP